MKSRRKIWSLMSSFIIALVLGSATTLVKAQSPQVFVSARSGNDSGTCTIALPCRTVNYALTQVQSAGEVSIIDFGDYDNSLTLTKSVTSTILRILSNSIELRSGANR